jgi:hypothetical protein
VVGELFDVTTDLAYTRREVREDRNKKENTGSATYRAAWYVDFGWM